MTPRADLDAERAVLGAMLTTESAIQAVIDTELAAEHFSHRQRHGYVFEAILELHQEGKPADAITVAAFLEKKGQLEQVGGRDAIHAHAAVVPAPGNADYYAELVREARHGSPEPEGLRFTPWTELRATAPPEPPWVLEGYIAQRALTVLAGKPKVAGKSTLACAIAEAVDANAATFLGRDVAGGPVVYLSEEGPASLAPKLSESGKSTALTREDAWPKPSWSQLIEAAVTEAQRIGAVLLIIDALAFWAAFAEGEEKDAGAAQAAMDALGAATAAGLAVLLVHHQRKAGGEDGDAVRGSGAIFGAVDILVELERLGEDSPAGHRRLVAIGRWPTTPAVLVIDRDAATGGWRVVGQAESRSESTTLGHRERILAALPDRAPGATEAELADLLHVDVRKVSGPLRDLLAKDHIAKTGGGVKGDPYRYWTPPKTPPKNSPAAGGESVPSFSPSPKGGEKEKRISDFPPRGKGENPKAPSSSAAVEEADALAETNRDGRHRLTEAEYAERFRARQEPLRPHTEPVDGARVREEGIEGR